MKTKLFICLFVLALLPVFSTAQEKVAGEQLTYKLPSPSLKGTVSVEETMATRRSQRKFLNDGVTIENISQILWAAYGVTKPLDFPQTRGGFRTAPSAGALYPLELYLLVGNIKGIEPGVYKYNAQNHSIIRVIAKDVKKELAVASYNQKMIEAAPACLFYSAIYSRMTKKYGERGRERYVCMDLGHSAQNVYLQAEALHLGTCAIGAFVDASVKTIMQLPEEEEPLYMMPIGKY